MARTYDYDVHLRWSDADRQGHVNNGRYATYAEDARIEWLDNLPGVDPERGVSLILARQEIDYHRQVLTQAERDKHMVMKCSTLKIGRTSLRIREELWGAEDTSPACTVVAVLVNFDYTAGRPQPWNDVQRSWIESFQGPEA